MKKLLFLFTIILLAACSEDIGSSENSEVSEASELRENLIICNEGNWQSDNGQLSFYDAATGTLTNQWFRKVNGMKLGDTPNDILQVNDTLIAIAVNWSNIIQYIHPDGTACGATENVPNNRRMCSDGRYLYVTSYAHTVVQSAECRAQSYYNSQPTLHSAPSTLHFQKGYVAKIDLKTKQVIATCETGWEPEGGKLYKGRLYVANSGGYSFSENHSYETTVSVIDAATMQTIKTIDTGCINLYGEVSQAGRYLCINSCGDYYDTAPATVILDCETDRTTVLPFPCTYNTTDGSLFYTVGSQFSYLTGEYTYHIHTIDPAALFDAPNGSSAVTDYIYNNVVTQKIREIQSPYELYVSPYTGNVYFTDARSYATAGYLYGYTKEGEQVFPPQKVYINPAHILAVKSNNIPSHSEVENGAAITVLEYQPAPGQFINTMPEATADDTPETMATKCTATLNDGGTVSLGGFGGYITFRFSQPVTNTPGQSDFRIYGNAHAGSSEPGIVMVSQDKNGNGLPDDEWFELTGSADEDCKDQLQYNYQITYNRAPMQDIPWTDNRGGSGVIARNTYHTQEYFPLWIKTNTLTFTGIRLPGNATETSGSGSNWVLSPFRFGYADNHPNSDAEANSFNIDRAVDCNRQLVRLSQIHFIRVYSALNQQCGWIGETSTEISGAEIIKKYPAFS